MRRRSLRKKVFERDAGICCECELDTEALRERIAQLRGEARAAAWKLFEAEGFVRYRSLWESDHQLALDEGGLDELENLVTRCQPCHRGKTSEQATRKAFLRKLVGKKFLKHRARRRETIGNFEGKISESSCEHGWVDLSISEGRRSSSARSRGRGTRAGGV